jgi:hypothetical protein
MPYVLTRPDLGGKPQYRGWRGTTTQADGAVKYHSERSARGQATRINQNLPQEAVWSVAALIPERRVNSGPTYELPIRGA